MKLQVQRSVSWQGKRKAKPQKQESKLVQAHKVPAKPKTEAFMWEIQEFISSISVWPFDRRLSVSTWGMRCIQGAGPLSDIL